MLCNWRAKLIKQGYRKFLAVGGDGTGHEILNGIFAAHANAERVALGFFRWAPATLSCATSPAKARSVSAGAPRKSHSPSRPDPPHPCRRRNFFLQLLSVGFTADVGALTNRVFKPFGHLGYLLGVFVRLAQLRPPRFAFAATTKPNGTDAEPFSHLQQQQIHRRHHADRSRRRSLRRLHRICALGAHRPLAAAAHAAQTYDGTAIEASAGIAAQSVKHVEFKIPVPVDVLIDGEIFSLECRSPGYLPSAVDVFI